MVSILNKIIAGISLGAMLAAGSAPAFAGDRHHRGHDRGRHYDAPRHHFKHHRPYNRHAYHGYRGYRGHYRGYYRHHGHGDAAGYAILGAVGGVIIGSMLADSARNDRPDIVYVERQSAPTRYVPEPDYNPAIAPAQTAGSCLQTREYQTTVVIGGVEREAYGAACLQPDGSWMRGPVQVAPRY